MKTLMKLMLLGFAALVAVAVVHSDAKPDRHGARRHGERIRRHVSVALGRERGEARTVRIVQAEAGSTIRKIPGLVSATLDRAKDEARRKLDDDVQAWLVPQVASSWKPPAHLVDAMIEGTRVAPEEKDYGTIYTAVIDADFSDAHRERLINAYRRDVAHERTLKLGGLLGFMLVCLAATSGYIRADEATRGYYTNRLRLAAAGAVGASGVLLYQFLA